MFSRVSTAAISGVESVKVNVEADVSDGLPMFSMVGFLASEVREAQDRVRAAMKNSGIVLPACRITVSLSPADLRKSGSWYDLPIAIAVLAAMGHIPAKQVEGILFAGELSLDGALNPVNGIMAMLSRAESFGCSRCIIPAANLAEGSVFGNLEVMGADHLSQVMDFLRGDGQLKTGICSIDQIRVLQERHLRLDFSDLRGQENLKRASEIAVSGFHNLLIIGPPGSGKTMTAKRIPTILPRVSEEEIFEISKIHSIAGTLPRQEGIITYRPFRSPHHSITSSAMIGGGIVPKPGEVSLAHRGVLYLDELPEFREEALETLRQPLEDGHIRISRLSGAYDFPADFMLVASMNPCKCGYFPDRNRCRCTPGDVKRYLERISQPLLDRIDLCVEASETTFDEISGSSFSINNGAKNKDQYNSQNIRERVEKVRMIQQERYQGTQYRSNADLDSAVLEKYCHLGKEQADLMRHVYQKLKLTGRSYVRILKVARTIADLDEQEDIQAEHLSEAVGLRTLDRKYWGSLL